jgi:hypothetical protein
MICSGVYIFFGIKILLQRRYYKIPNIERSWLALLGLVSEALLSREIFDTLLETLILIEWWKV